MPKDLSDAHKKAMQKGREKARKEKQKEQIKRVEVYQAWLKAGAFFCDIPPVPTDADYRIWRSAKDSK